MFKPGDLHAETTAKLLKIPVEQVTARQRKQTKSYALGISYRLERRRSMDRRTGVRNRYLGQALREWNVNQPARLPFKKYADLPASVQSLIDERALELEIENFAKELVELHLENSRRLPESR